MKIVFDMVRRILNWERCVPSPPLGDTQAEVNIPTAAEALAASKAAAEARRCETPKEVFLAKFEKYISRAVADGERETREYVVMGNVLYDLRLPIPKRPYGLNEAVDELASKRYKIRIGDLQGLEFWITISWGEE